VPAAEAARRSAADERGEARPAAARQRRLRRAARRHGVQRHVRAQHARLCSVKARRLLAQRAQRLGAPLPPRHAAALTARVIARRRRLLGGVQAAQRDEVLADVSR
jgi:hypothetical protein